MKRPDMKDPLLLFWRVKISILNHFIKTHNRYSRLTDQLNLKTPDGEKESRRESETVQEKREKSHGTEKNPKLNRIPATSVARFSFQSAGIHPFSEITHKPMKRGNKR